MSKFRLKLKRLDFISAVDAGAQGTIADVALIKRRDADTIEAVCQVAKLDESLGLVFGWALASSLDGGKTPHVDLQGDAIDEADIIKVAAEFMEAAASSDVMHDDVPDGKIVFAMPLVPEVNKALGIESNVHGLAIAMKPSQATFKRFQSGELRAFSIAGVGERSPLEKRDDSYASILKAAVSKRDAALAQFDAEQAAFEKANGIPPGRGIVRFTETIEGREAYRAFSKADAEAQAIAGAGGRHRTPAALAKRESTFDALEKGLAAFCKSRGIANVWTDGLDAYRATPEGRALTDAVNAATNGDNR